MQNYKKFTVSENEYEIIKKTLSQNKAPFKEHSHGSRKSLFLNSRLIASTSIDASLELGDLSKSSFVSFLGQFNKQLYSRLFLNPELISLKINFNRVAREKNVKFWNTLNVGTYFYNVDLSSAYWQMAHKLGYIEDKMFEKYLNLDSFKQAKRYCISFLARTNKMTYQMSNKEYEITCDNTLLRQVYDNVRNQLYLCIETALNGVSDFIEYNIDGVMVMSQDLEIVMSNLEKMNLKFKITECRKVTNQEYTYSGSLRKFVNNNKLSQLV